MRGDLGLGFATADALGSPGPAGALARRLSGLLTAEGHEGKHFTSMLTLYERWADIEVRLR